MKKYINIILIALAVFILSGSQSTQAQPVKVIGITQPVTISGYTVRVMQPGITNIKLIKLDNSVTKSGVEIGSTGFYRFDFAGISNVPGNYKLYINDVEKQEYGIVQIATFLDSLGTVTMGGNFNLGTHRITNLANATTGTDALSRAYADNRYLSLNIGRSQVVTDEIILSGGVSRTDSPTSDNDLTNKAYVDSLVAHIVFTPVQFSTKIRRIIASGSEIPGRDYKTVDNAEASISSTSGINRYRIFLEEGISISAYTTDNLFFASHSSLKDYVSLIGDGSVSILVLGSSSANVTKSGVSIENCTVIFGAGDISANRTYNGFNFENCTIYAFRGTTFNNTSMKNCDVVHANSYNATLSGTGKYTFCTFSGNVTKSSFTGITPGLIDGYDSNPTMPSDPTVAE